MEKETLLKITSIVNATIEGYKKNDKVVGVYVRGHISKNKGEKSILGIYAICDGVNINDPKLIIDEFDITTDNFNIFACQCDSKNYSLNNINLNNKHLMQGNIIYDPKNILNYTLENIKNSLSIQELKRMLEDTKKYNDLSQMYNMIGNQQFNDFNKKKGYVKNKHKKNQ